MSAFDWLVAVAGFAAGCLVWALFRAWWNPVRGLDSLDVPPPEVYDGPLHDYDG